MLVDDLTVSGLLRVLREMQADKLTCDQINEISGEDLSTLVQNLSDISDKLSTIQSTIDQCETDASTFKTGIADAIKGVDSTATVTGDSSLPDFTSGIQNIVPNVTSDATAAAGHILSGKTAYVNGSKVTGTIANYSGQWRWANSDNNGGFGISNYTYSSGANADMVYAYINPGYVDSGTKIILDTKSTIASYLIAGKSLFGVSGTATSDANAAAGQILSGYTAYVNGNKVSGIIPDRRKLGLSGMVGLNSGGWSNVAVSITACWHDQTNTDGVRRLCLQAPGGLYGGYDSNINGAGDGYVGIDLSSLGNASTSSVLSGSTFTSSAGVNVTGTIVQAGFTDLYESINADVDTSTYGEYASIGFPRSVAIGIRSAYYCQVSGGSTFSPLGSTPTIIVPWSDLADAIGLTSKLSSISKYTTILGKTGTLEAYGGGEYKDTSRVFTSNSYIVFQAPATSAIFGGGSGIRASMSNFGTATPGQVLSGSTFTSSSGLNMTGTMNNYGGQTIAGDLTEADGSVVKFRVTTGGYCSGTTKITRPYSTVASALGITAAKIAKGYTICGVAGTYTGAAYNCRTWSYTAEVGTGSTGSVFTLYGGTKTLSSSSWVNSANSTYSSYYSGQIDDLSGKINSSTFAVCRVTAPTYGIRRGNGYGSGSTTASYRYLKELVLFADDYLSQAGMDGVDWAGTHEAHVPSGTYIKRIRGYWLDSNRDNSSSSASSHQLVEFYITEQGYVCVEFIASTANVFAFKGPLKFEFWVFYK